MERTDLEMSLSLIKAMKPYQREQFFASNEGREFVKSLRGSVPDDVVDSLEKAVGMDAYNTHLSLNDVSQYSPTEILEPVDRTKEMTAYPDKRLNSDHVYRAIGARILDPQQYWRKESDLCHMFKASPESIEAALFTHVGDGRVAYEKTDKELLFAKA